MMEVRRTYKYRLYRSSRNKRLNRTINIAGLIWNHCVALQRRYYRLTGKYIHQSKLKAHIARLRRKSHRYSHWKLLGSQAVQDIIERLDAGYQRFFQKQCGRPSFKNVKRYRSFTLKQVGWKLLGGNKIRILGKTYKFVKHREIGGTIKTVTIKRDNLNRLWIAFSVVETLHIPKASTGKIGGFDFGVKTFLTDDEGRSLDSPQIFKDALAGVAKAHRGLSHKQEGSRNCQRANRKLGLAHEHIANKRRDHHFKLAHDLCNEYDRMFFETPNIKAMRRLWGRKALDLGFPQFIEILRYIAFIRGKQVHLIDMWEPTTQACSGCGHRQKLDLAQHIFDCPRCGLHIDRDHNAAINIKRAGTSALGLEDVRRSNERNLA